MTRVERLWKFRLAFSELVCNRIFTRPAAGCHLLSRNVVLAGTVAFTPGSQLSRVIGSSASGMGVLAPSRASAAARVTPAGAGLSRCAVRPSSREVNRNRRQDDRANNHEDNKCQ